MKLCLDRWVYFSDVFVFGLEYKFRVVRGFEGVVLLITCWVVFFSLFYMCGSEGAFVIVVRVRCNENLYGVYII